MFEKFSSFTNIYKIKAYPNYWDLIALVMVLSIILLLAWNAKQMVVPYEVGQATPISLDTSYLPGYALRTVLRMFIALFFSLAFTFIFGTWAAKSERAEKIIIPAIDILQSVPILGFLSISVVAFITLFPGSLLGPECAAIFVIFTSQAWNMALGFYQTVKAVPDELNEAATMFHLSAWQRFWRIDAAYSMPGLLWNTMASMSAGWFFVVASEAISVSNQEILLPGIGSYIRVANQSANMSAIAYAVLAMFLVILIYDQILFRPLVAWSEKFKAELVPQETKEVRSWVLNILNRTRFLRYIGGIILNLFNKFINISFMKTSPTQTIKPKPSALSAYAPLLWNIFCISILVAAFAFCFLFTVKNVPIKEIGYVFYLGLITAFRVFLLVIVASLIWVPFGVWAGLRPNVAYFVQPIAQFLAAFPANLFYPFVVIFIVTYHLNVNIWATPLMILGAQWYILFNVIAGASLIPKDLIQACDNLGLSTWLRWRSLVLPAIFPYYVTGAITAAGGAWNASIVAEVVSWGDTKLVATGLGAYISEQTEKGDFVNTALSIGVMCILVLLFNHFLWRPLYRYSENRFKL